MRESFDKQQYWDYLHEKQEKFNLDLDLKRYEYFPDIDFNFTDLLQVPSAITAAGIALTEDACHNLSEVDNIKN